METDVFVEIVRFSDGHVETRMGPMGERQADRTLRGALINLNRDEWFVRTVPANEEPTP